MPSTILHRSFSSSLLRREWPYILCVPGEIADPPRPSPVVYLLHGACGCAQDYLDQGSLQATLERLLAHGRIEPAVFVMPEGFASWYVDSDYLLMQQAFLEEFMPHVEQEITRPTLRSQRAIAGLSMGGFGALRFALLRPELFNAVALMSPAVYHDLPPEGSSARLDPPFQRNGVFDPQTWHSHLYTGLLDAYVAREMPLRFHVASGAEDEYGIAGEALRLYQDLRRRDQDAIFNLAPGRHDWSTWTVALETALPFLLDPLQQAHGVVSLLA